LRAWWARRCSMPTRARRASRPSERVPMAEAELLLEKLVRERS
jgi:hypothetical protein